MPQGRLVRSTNEKWLAGVCGGIGAWLGTTPNQARLIWVLLSLLPGPMWVLYAVLWVALPERRT